MTNRWIGQQQHQGQRRYPAEEESSSISPLSTVVPAKTTMENEENWYTTRKTRVEKESFVWLDSPPALTGLALRSGFESSSALNWSVAAAWRRNDSVSSVAESFIAVWFAAVFGERLKIYYDCCCCCCCYTSKREYVAVYSSFWKIAFFIPCLASYSFVHSNVIQAPLNVDATVPFAGGRGIGWLLLWLFLSTPL